MNRREQVKVTMSNFQLKRHEANPIITPGGPWWRKCVTFNPGAIYENGKFYLFERAAGSLRPFRCQIGLLTSDDGVRFELASDEPVFGCKHMPEDTGSIQDPRVVKIEDTYYMTFAYRPLAYLCYPTGLGVPTYESQAGSLDYGENNTRSGIAVSRDLMHWEFKGFVTPPEIDDRDVILFPEKINGKYAVLRRPRDWWGAGYPASGPAIWLSYSDDLETWTDAVVVAGPEQEWEGGKIGGAAPPLRTDQGWLTLFHGVDERSRYRVGVMMLDLDDPTKVIARSPDSILEPEAYYEQVGLVIPNVVFPTANVVKDGTIYIYYGGADTCINLATIGQQELIDYVMQYRIQQR